MVERRVELTASMCATNQGRGSKRPRVSILVPVYNCELTIRASLDSILAQTFTDFELIIIDDGSTDSTLDIIQSYSDPRIVCVQMEKNGGMIAALNHGLQSVKGDYIARMDGDDIVLPEWLEKLTDFLDKNPTIGVVSPNAISIDESGIPFGPIYPGEELPPHIVVWELLFGHPLLHSTAVFRAPILVAMKTYPDVPHAEDYALWMILRSKIRMAVHGELLAQIRKTNRNVSYIFSSVQMENMLNETRKVLADIISEQPDDETLLAAKHLHPPGRISEKSFVGAVRLYSESLKKTIDEFMLSDSEIDELEERLTRRIFVLLDLYPQKRRIAVPLVWERLRMTPRVFKRPNVAKVLGKILAGKNTSLLIRSVFGR